MIDRAPNMTEKLACTLLAWLEALGDPIPRDHAQAMSADQICSLFEFDHWPVRRVDGGTNHPDNLRPLFIAAHGHKTATIDQPQISKRKRIVAKEAARTKRAADPVIAEILEEVRGIYGEVLAHRSRWSRPKATIRGAGFRKDVTKTMRGKVVPRKQRRQRS